MSLQMCLHMSLHVGHTSQRSKEAQQPRARRASAEHLDLAPFAAAPCGVDMTLRCRYDGNILSGQSRLRQGAMHGCTASGRHPWVLLSWPICIETLYVLLHDQRHTAAVGSAVKSLGTSTGRGSLCRLALLRTVFWGFDIHRGTHIL